MLSPILILHPPAPTLGQQRLLTLLRTLLPDSATFAPTRSLLRDVLPSLIRGQRPHTILALGPTAAQRAALLRPRHLICAVPAEIDLTHHSAGRYSAHRAVSLYRAISDTAHTTFICETAGSQRTLIRRGLPPDRVHLIRPGVDLAALRLASASATTIRTDLGAQPDHRIIFAPGDSTHAAHHGLSVWSAAILAELHPHYRLLLSGQGPASTSMQGFISRMVDPTSVLVASRAPLPKRAPTALPPRITPARAFTHEELFAAADVILFTPRGPIEPWPITAALASGKPIVSTVTPGQCELLEDRHTCLMATAPTPRLLARRLLDLHNDPTLAWQLADRARAESYDLHPISKQRQAWIELLRPDHPAPRTVASAFSR